ncbi:chromosome partitioning protein [Micromonospora sp. C51]|uniref:MinD/ParA family ATP-binding protein n=1 Tax=Micromonospora sp. C51 TaxID=2824879 RepID=UPI001B39B2CE|nr:chromosome partitioning protein [Micromonospora sp. C51]MBQ1050481.1 chromosome partitioning protein [Micromonospora sp. C51]
MVDDNADRVHVPGQHGMPERDIEPLWPPEQIDGFGAPTWGAPPPVPPTVPPPPGHPSPAQPPNRPPVAQPTDPPSVAGPAYPPQVVGPAYPPTAAEPQHVPGRPTHAPGAPPSPADYPSLTNGAPTASGWEPVPQPGPGQVDLDLPFTLDRPTAVTPTRDGGPAESGDQDPSNDAMTVAAPRADDAAPPVARPQAEPVARPQAEPVAGPQAEPVGRPQTESPWAHPPQRSGSDSVASAETSAGAPRPTWAGPAQPLPPIPQPLPATPQQPGPYPFVAPPTAQHGSAPVPQPGAPLPPVPSDTGVPAAPPPSDPQPADVGPDAPPPPDPLTPQSYAPAPPGPFPPQPAWSPAPWQQGGTPPMAPAAPQQPYPQTNTASRVPSAYSEPAWNPEVGAAPTAEDFARRRQVRPADPVATTGLRAVVNKTGLVKLPPGRHELERKRDIEMVRRNFGGLRQVTVVNPKGGAGKTVAILLLAMTFGQNRGGYVLAWDNNETQGTLGMRAQQDFHSRTVRDLLRDLGQFHGAQGRVGDLSQYVRSQGEGMFDVLASDESATGGEMLTAAAFGEIREVVSRFYKLIFVDTGNNVRAQNWQAAMDATDQLVVTMSARNDSAETAARMLDHLEQSGRQRLVRQAVTVVSMPPSRKEIDLPAIQEHFAARTRAVLLAPYERLIDTGEPLRYAQLSTATRDAWLKIAASVAEGL